jgi:hypothetical protein
MNPVSKYSIARSFIQYETSILNSRRRPEIGGALNIERPRFSGRDLIYIDRIL